MARARKRGRPVTGLLVLDKPAGLSSNQALQQARRLFFANKAGHTGSLDPLATGVLPLCFGEATKFSQYLLNADKSYQATVVLGAQSSTEDADGELAYVADTARLSVEKIAEAVSAQQGEQQQVPPMYSALKHNGRRLYELARQGQQIEREARDICVHSIQLMAVRQNIAFEHLGVYGQPVGHQACEIDLAVSVSKGTYIRSLAAEVGRRLGVGGYVRALRRTHVSVFSEADAVSLESLEQLKQEGGFEAVDALLRPVTDALSHITGVILDDNSGYYLRRGNPVMVPKAPASGAVKLLLENGEFVGIGEIDDQGLVAPRRLIAENF